MRTLDRVIVGRVDSTGAVVAGDGFTVRKIATGQYTVTLTSGVRLVAAVASANVVAGGWMQTGAHTEKSFNVYSFTAANVAGDQYFTFIAAGYAQ